jgi:transcriptional regulator with XRE-family HTH domain
MTSASTTTAAWSGTVQLPARAPATSMSNEVAGLRDRVDLLHADVRDLHNGARTQDLEEATSALTQREPRELLDVLAVARGMSWVDIARLVGVSIPALRKWRLGENVSSENRQKLARLTAFLDMIARAPIHDVAAWMEITLTSDTTLTPADIYLGDRVDLLLERAFERMTAYQLLDQFDADWRRQHAADDRFTKRVADDGNVTLVERAER